MVRHDDQNGPLDQADRLRRMMSGGLSEQVQSSDPTHVIAIVSGKGGVGKTLIACNLSIAMAGRGHRVLLFDMDMGLANADIVLGVEPAWTWSDVIRGRRSLEEVAVQGPGGIAFVPGRSGATDVANLSEFERHQLLRALQQIERQYDVMVLDCGAGMSRNVVGVAGSADTVLVVATPEPTAMTDAYAMIKAFAQQRDFSGAGPMAESSVGVVVNNATSRREARQTFERLADVAARFLHMPVTDYGYVLADEHVPVAVRHRQPVLLSYPRSTASCCLMALAGRLSREMGFAENRQNLFRRVMNLFI